MSVKVVFKSGTAIQVHESDLDKILQAIQNSTPYITVREQSLYTVLVE